MKKASIVLELCFFATFIANGQQLTDSLLTTFYNKTLTLYFSDTTSRKEDMKYSCMLVETNFDITRLVKTVGTKRLRYYNNKTSVIPLLDRPLKKNIGRGIYWVSHDTIAQDTIEINMGGWTIGNVKKKSIALGIWCGGTMGHIAAGRFVYDRSNQNWTFISGHQILQAKMDEFNKQLHNPKQ
jgi:hypothetical protein